ncbi:MAG: prolyl oligopeptidase family serine peptidase, partial [Phycisphaerales bacterium]
STDHRTHEAFISYTSYDSPRTIFQTHVMHPKLAPWARTEIPGDLSAYTVEQKRAKSKDGTEVPMFIVRRKDMKLDGTNPTLLYGYGGFNVSLTPSFNPTIVPWLDAGGVYVVANLRGGGEFGEEWHRAGMGAVKQNVFDDFYACAEWLIREKYTSSAHLAIEGGSNGGLLTGVASTQRPDLFAAAIVAVPLLDMVRYHDFLIARYWVPEYGSSEDGAQFRTLFAYSPYHNVKKGAKYPALLVTAGENDSRVHPLHARKFAARVQALASNDAAKDPILLWVDRDAGHGQGKPLALRIRDEVDQWSFVMSQTGACAP